MVSDKKPDKNGHQILGSAFSIMTFGRALQWLANGSAFLRIHIVQNAIPLLSIWKGSALLIFIG